MKVNSQKKIASHPLLTCRTGFTQTEPQSEAVRVELNFNSRVTVSVSVVSRTCVVHALETQSFGKAIRYGRRNRAKRRQNAYQQQYEMCICSKVTDAENLEERLFNHCFMLLLFDAFNRFNRIRIVPI